MKRGLRQHGCNECPRTAESTAHSSNGDDASTLPIFRNGTEKPDVLSPSSFVGLNGI